VLRRLRTRGRPAPDPAADIAPEPAVAEPAPSAGTAGPVEVDQPPRLVIFGQVTTGGNTALPGATLTLTDLSGRQLDRDSSDSAGHYRLRPPTGGSYLVISASAAHQPTAALLAGAGASLSGSVATAETGEAIGNAVVTLVDIRGDVAAATVTEDDGRFAFFELAQGLYTLTVAASSLQPVARSVEVPASGHVTYNVEVASRVQLVGVVRTATAGVPVPEALATLIASDGQVVGSVLTDNGGGFVFDDLATGTYTLIATGYPPVAAEVHVRGGAPTETAITLWPTTVGPAGVGPADAVAGYGPTGTHREDDAHGTD
jgi:Carboxypeptidase regulatory-like domain